MDHPEDVKDTQPSQAWSIDTAYSCLQHKSSCLQYFLNIIFLSLLNYLGQTGRDIAWYINGLLVPELTLSRGKNYTFRVFGGNNITHGSYHPFYITDSLFGGRLLSTPAQRRVGKDGVLWCCMSDHRYILCMLSQSERVFAGFEENDQPTGGQYHKAL